MASPRRGRPHFTKTFRLEPWRSGLKTDHTASTLPNPLGWQNRYATLNTGRAGRRLRVGESYLRRLGRLLRIPRRHLDVIHRRPNVTRVPRRSPATPIPCCHHPGFLSINRYFIPFMTFIPFMAPIMTILYHVFISFISGIRDADILLEHHTETPILNVEAVTHAENRLR